MAFFGWFNELLFARIREPRLNRARWASTAFAPGIYWCIAEDVLECNRCPEIDSCGFTKIDY